VLFLYQIGIRIFYLLILAISPVSGKARNWIGGRREYRSRLDEYSPDPARRTLWMHAASLGEFEQGRSLIGQWKEKNPDDRILVSFFSPSGFTIRKDYPGADLVFYLPLDTRRNMVRLIRKLKPDRFILVKYDFWPNLLTSLNRLDIPSYLVSAQFRENQYLFKIWGRPFLKRISLFRHIFVQDGSSLQLLKRHGITQVTMAGDTRVDAVMMEKGERRKEKERPILIAGSTWPAEEKMLAEVWFSPDFKNILAGWKLIVAPHDVSEHHLKEIEVRYGGGMVRYSEVKDIEDGDWKILLVDSIGHLAGLYSLGSLALIGGGFGKGIHNILEPTAYGLPVLFGPNWQKFREAHDLIRAGSAFSFKDRNQLSDLIKKFASDQKYLSQTGNLALNYMENQKGSTGLIISYLMEKN